MEFSPKYSEITRWIQEQIKSGALKPGDKLLSENELAQKFDLSRQTVRRALKELEDLDLIYSVRGSGTYVRENRRNSLVNRKRIALMMTYIDGYIFPRTIQGMEDVLYEKGYSVQISFTNNKVERERAILEDIIARDEVAGILAETTKSGLPNPNLSLYKTLMDMKIPVLFINSHYQGLKAPHVSMNDFQAGYEATKLLITNGHRRIAGIFKCDDGQGHARYAGYMQALTEAGISTSEGQIAWVDTEDVKNLWKVSDKLLDRINGCTGVVSYNDEVAFSLLDILKQNSIAVPEDVSVSSIDDSDLAVMGDVKLCSVQYPMEKLGKKATENLIQMIHNPAFDGSYEFEVHSVKRESVKSVV